MIYSIAFLSLALATISHIEECPQITPDSYIVVVDFQKCFLPESLNNGRLDGNLALQAIKGEFAKKIFKNASDFIKKGIDANANINYSLDNHTPKHCSFRNPENEKPKELPFEFATSTAKHCKDEDSIGRLEKNELLLWNKHCVLGEEESQLHNDILKATTPKTKYIRKGVEADKDSYSALGGYVSNSQKGSLIDSDGTNITPDRAKNLDDLGKVDKRQTFREYLNEKTKDKSKGEPRGTAFVLGLAVEVCVAKTAEDLVEAGFKVYVIGDASGGVSGKGVIEYYDKWHTNGDGLGPHLLVKRGDSKYCIPNESEYGNIKTEITKYYPHPTSTK